MEKGHLRGICVLCDSNFCDEIWEKNLKLGNKFAVKMNQYGVLPDLYLELGPWYKIKFGERYWMVIIIILKQKFILKGVKIEQNKFQKEQFGIGKKTPKW